MKHLPRLIGIASALAAVALVYEGLMDAFFNREWLWAAPVLLSLITVALLLWDEERAAKRAEAERERERQERNSRLREQDVFGSSSNDKVF